MNPTNAHAYYGTNDLVLTCADLQGLKMTIKANSMRLPNGTLVTPETPTVVSLNQVHHDNVPMPIPDGASPPYAGTLQPGGATFDPPIQIEWPNMSGLPAGSIAWFLNYNHDTERFEIIASGHVRDDSTTIVSDPGAGLSIAGWHCNCPPYSVTGQCIYCDTHCLKNCSLSGGQVTANATEVCAGASFSFEATGVVVNDGQMETVCVDENGHVVSRTVFSLGCAAKYKYSIKRDGTEVATGNSSTASVSMAPAGIYTCEFTVETGDPCPAQPLHLSGPSVQVDGLQSVVAKADGQDELSRCVNAPVNFTADVMQINCGNLQYSWAFSDGATATGQSVSHQFLARGDYTATVTVTCSGTNCMDTKSDTAVVHISELQSVDAKANGEDIKLLVLVGDTVNFTATTMPPNFGDVTFDWAFGNGETAQGKSVSYMYPMPGVFTATVRAQCMDGSGPIREDSVQVVVIAPIEADIVDPPAGRGMFASGIKESSIVLKLNDRTVSPAISGPANRKHIFYKPRLDELNLSGENTVSLEATDNADGDGTTGNPVSQSWTFRIQ